MTGLSRRTFHKIPPPENPLSEYSPSPRFPSLSNNTYTSAPPPDKLLLLSKDDSQNTSFPQKEQIVTENLRSLPSQADSCMNFINNMIWSDLHWFKTIIVHEVYNPSFKTFSTYFPYLFRWHSRLLCSHWIHNARTHQDRISSSVEAGT
jgi:hypothetical protein